MRFFPVVFLLSFAGVAVAEDANTVEALSEIGDSEVASMERQSIQSRGRDTAFEVSVKWRDPGQRPPDAPAGRVIRYVANCSEKTIVVAAVTTMDQNGRIRKRYLVPPGGADFLPAKEGSAEQRWMKDACG